MNQNTGEILTTEELQDRVSSATQEEQAAIRAAFETLTQGQYDKYSQLPQSERPAAKAFDDYLGKKRRVNEPRTQRQAFYAGYQAAKKTLDTKTTVGEEVVAIAKSEGSTT